MVPLTIVLKGKVTIKIPFFGKKTLFQRDLYRYQASKISSNIFYIQTKDPDPSPPEISDYSTEVSWGYRDQIAPWFFVPFFLIW